MRETGVPPGQIGDDTFAKRRAMSDSYPATPTRCGSCAWFVFTDRSSIYRVCTAPTKPEWVDGKCGAWKDTPWTRPQNAPESTITETE